MPTFSAIGAGIASFFGGSAAAGVGAAGAAGTAALAGGEGAAIAGGLTAAEAGAATAGLASGAAAGGSLFAGGLTTAAAAGVGAGSILSTVGEVATAAQGVVGAIGANQSAQAQARAAATQQSIAQQQQSLYSQAVQQTAAAGAAAVQGKELKTRATAGAIEANQAASGIDVNSGSAVGVQASNAELGQLSAQNINSQYAQQAYGYETQAAAAGLQGRLYGQEAAQAPIAGLFGGAGSLLSGASGVASQYARWATIAGGGGGNYSTLF